MMNLNLNNKIFALVCISIILKTLLIILYPGIGGDSISYKYVALNIFQNNCISLSEPDSMTCIPHWGGNQLPGYPLFLATNYFLFGINDIAPRITAAIIGSFAAFILIRQFYKLLDHKVLSILAIILLFSPLYFAQARFLLTEQINIAFIMLLAAEIIQSLKFKKTNLIKLSIIFTILFFLRYDNIVLIFPIIILVYIVNKKNDYMKYLVIFLCLILIPIGGITIRHNNVGLPLIPTPRYIHDGSKNPNGYINWAKTWMYKAKHQELVMYPIAYKNYKKIILPSDNSMSRFCAEKSKNLIERLHSFDNLYFPDNIDKEFQKLVENPKCTNTIRKSFLLNSKRLIYMWGNFTSSFGWPTKELGLKNKLIDEFKSFILKQDSKSFSIALHTIKDNLPFISARIISNLYWLLLCVLLLMNMFLRKGQNKIFSSFAIVTYSYIISKTIFLVLIVGTSFEIRLLYSLIPFMEITAIMLLVHIVYPKNLVKI